MTDLISSASKEKRPNCSACPKANCKHSPRAPGQAARCVSISFLSLAVSPVLVPLRERRQPQSSPIRSGWHIRPCAKKKRSDGASEIKRNRTKIIKIWFLPRSGVSLQGSFFQPPLHSFGVDAPRRLSGCCSKNDDEPKALLMRRAAPKKK